MTERVTTMGIVLDAAHSHLFPGMAFEDQRNSPSLALLDELDGVAPALVRFGDGTQASGVIAPIAPGRWSLALARYRTAAGTDMIARTWDIESRPTTGAGRKLHVASRADRHT